LLTRTNAIPNCNNATANRTNPNPDPNPNPTLAGPEFRRSQI